MNTSFTFLSGAVKEDMQWEVYLQALEKYHCVHSKGLKLF